ncbi:MAG: hypothetical protein M3460_27090 [Actinomycetota bacterium]|nr:hypothetical protein [Actinomycetota bacterium]
MARRRGVQPPVAGCRSWRRAATGGTVLAAQPVTSPERLSEEVAGLLNTAMHRQELHDFS